MLHFVGYESTNANGRDRLRYQQHIKCEDQHEPIFSVVSNYKLFRAKFPLLFYISFLYKWREDDQEVHFEALEVGDKSTH